MQINPDNQTFSEIRALTEEEMKKIMKIEREEYRNEELAAEKLQFVEEEVLATGSKENLEKLQNDLRRAGYRQQFGK